MALPIGLYVLINSLRLPLIQLGPLTIPLLPSAPRYYTDTAFYGQNPFPLLFGNFVQLIKLLLDRTNEAPFDVVAPFGYFYQYTFLFSLMGAFILYPFKRRWYASRRLIVLLWLATAFVVGCFVPPNIHRMNLIFIPLILCLSIFLLWLYRHLKIMGICAGFTLFTCFIFFTIVFHGSKYRQEADNWFFTGLLPAINYAREFRGSPICVTDEKINMPYIFVLFSEKMSPPYDPANIHYVDPTDQFRKVQSIGRYTFGIQNCRADNNIIYILFFKERPPASNHSFVVRNFGLYSVYIPK